MSDFKTISRTRWLELAQRLLDRLEHSWTAFTPSEWNRFTPYLGWRVRDVVAHMASATPVNFREMLQRALAGDPSPPPEFDTFTRNARAVAARRNLPTADLVREFRSESQAMLTTYRDMSDSDWLKPAWFLVGPITVRTLFILQLADNVLHERDLLLVNRRWKGFDPDYLDPLADWFLRELRPANFRPARADGLQAAVLYKLSGPGGGEWTLVVTGRTCSVAPAATVPPDVVVDAKAEDLFAAAQGRASPQVGRLGRKVDWILGPSHAEEVVAAVTGGASLVSALLQRRIRLRGSLVTFYRVDRCFWRFWQRTRQTKENIARDRRP